MAIENEAINVSTEGSPSRFLEGSTVDEPLEARVILQSAHLPGGTTRPTPSSLAVEEQGYVLLPRH